MRARDIHIIPYGAACALLLLLASCEYEGRAVRPTPSATAMPPLTPGPAAAAAKTPGSDQRNVMAVSEGKQMYHRFNCVGCHAAGGGAIGPALMDEKWIYGSDAAAIHAAILDGRPNGMPSFRGKIRDDDAWKIAAYVRSLSGLDTRLPEGSTSQPRQEEVPGKLQEAPQPVRQDQ